VDRRAFIAGTLALVAKPLGADAQRAARVHRIGWLSNVPPTASEMSTEAFRLAFRELGYVEGQNLAIEFRWADSAPNHLSGLADELIRLKVDAIVAIGPQAILAAKQATSVIPIVMMTSGDPVGLGFVGSLARPDGNVTGLSFLGETLSGKLLELLKQAVPRASHVGILWNPANSTHARYWGDVREAARALGVTLHSIEVSGADEFEQAFGQATRAHADALLLLLDPLFTAKSRLIADFAAKSRLPTIYGLRQVADAGGLMAYGPNSAEMARRAAGYVDRILKGAKPGDLPVEQPTKFELVINLKTAKALGLTIPQSVLLRADEVIQ
jgi:putative ABC transport system substrate-binding protein